MVSEIWGSTCKTLTFFSDDAVAATCLKLGDVIPLHEAYTQFFFRDRTTFSFFSTNFQTFRKFFGTKTGGLISQERDVTETSS